MLLVPSQLQPTTGNTGQTYRRVGMGKVLIRCDPEGDYSGPWSADNGLAAEVAAALISEGYERTVTIV
jgi:hypothetical protein